MEIGKLRVQTRTKTGKGPARQLRARGLVPGVCYGLGFDEALKITASPKALQASLDPKKRQNTLLDVEIEGGSHAPIKALLWDYQIDPIRREVTHFDLISIDPEQPVDAHVEVILTGRSPGVVDGGQLSVARHFVTIKARPADIPEKFTLDISNLHLSETLHIRDIPTGEGVHITTPGALTVLTCQAPRRDRALEVAAAEEAEASKEEEPAVKKK